MFKLLILAAGFAVISVSPGEAQYYDSQCRPVARPGYIMQPGPPDPGCIQSRQAQEAAARAEAAERHAAKAAERQKCESVSVGQLRSTMEQAPLIDNGYMKIIDVARPQYDEERDMCSVRAMTNRGVVPAIVSFEEFNGSPYLRIRFLTNFIQ
jgi:hypothetical protein